MIDFEHLSLFETYTDSDSGVTSYILKNKPAECVQSFYFTNQSLSDDQRYLWMYCFYPPMRHRSLGVACLETGKPYVRAFKEAVFHAASPLVAPEGDKVYFVDSVADAGLICTVDVNGHIEAFAQIDPAYIDKRAVQLFSTHLSISADGQYMLVDGMFATHGFVAIVNMATREFKVINEYEDFHNHAQFSPVHPNLFLLDQDWRNNPITGKYICYKNRSWLCDTQATVYEPLLQSSWYGHDGSLISHDFWSLDGRVCWQDYKKGAYEMDLNTHEVMHVWKEPLCHVHCNADRSLWVADQSPYEWPNKNCRVIFYNRATTKTIDIFSNMPAPIHPRNNYHIDPHPQFSKDGRYIVCTTTVRGSIDISVTPVDQLVMLTQ